MVYIEQISITILVFTKAGNRYSVLTIYSSAYPAYRIKFEAIKKKKKDRIVTTHVKFDRSQMSISIDRRYKT